MVSGCHKSKYPLTLVSPLSLNTEKLGSPNLEVWTIPSTISLTQYISIFLKVLGEFFQVESSQIDLLGFASRTETPHPSQPIHARFTNDVCETTHPDPGGRQHWLDADGALQQLTHCFQLTLVTGSTLSIRLRDLLF